MAQGPHRGVALLSIHPRHAESILSGNKKVEFRRVRFKRDVSHVVVYATAPVGKVVGWFSVKEIDSRHPRMLWRRYRQVSGVSSKEFNAYFDGVEQGTAIAVDVAERLVEPIPLATISPSFTPPQSYRYVDPTAFARLVGG